MALAQPPMPLASALAEIYAHASKARRRQFYLVLSLMLVGSLAELATIGSVIPFIALLTNGGTPAYLARPAALLGASPVLTAAFLFAAFALCSGAARLALSWVTQDFIHKLGHDLALEVQRRILAQSYSFHIERNTSSLIAGLTLVEVLMFEALLPLMQTVIAAFIATVILAGLISIDPATAIVATVAFALIYLIVSAVTARRLAANSAVIGTDYRERFKLVQESLGGIRDVIIDHSQAMHLTMFDSVNSRLAQARANTAFMTAAPRYLIETAGMLVIAALALFISGREHGISAALPLLGAVALGAQRLLPLAHTVYAGWSTLAGNRSAVGQVVELLRLPIERRPPALAPLDLRQQIAFEDVSFAYSGRDRTALENISFSIPRGSMIGIIGPTGSGKSTLLDLLMGLLQPHSGTILVDDVPLDPAVQQQWHRSIAHVPQSIFLADLTIARNIALSRPDTAPNRERIVESAKKAQLHDFIESLPAGYETLIGERGIRLSGGQRQRLGIARAIYKDAPVLVLDEATSALDELTEAAVIAALQELRGEGRTVIIVAHRQSTIRHCDLVARLDHGRLVEFGPLNGAADARKRFVRAPKS
jgi:ATP-binding cassette subfamily B protein